MVVSCDEVVWFELEKRIVPEEPRVSYERVVSSASESTYEASSK